MTVRTRRESPRSGAADGLATIGPDMLRLVGLLDACFLDWAREFGADEVSYPPLLQVADLKRIDYFDHFSLFASAAWRIPVGCAERTCEC